MIDRDSPVTEDELHAYVDLQLDPTDRAQAEARLALRPLDRARANAYRALNIELHALFDERLPPMSSALRELSDRVIRRYGYLNDKWITRWTMLRAARSALAWLLRSPGHARSQGL